MLGKGNIRLIATPLLGEARDIGYNHLIRALSFMNHDVRVA